MPKPEPKAGEVRIKTIMSPIHNHDVPVHVQHLHPTHLQYQLPHCHQSQVRLVYSHSFRGIIHRNFGEPVDVLEQADMPKPEPKAGEVRIKTIRNSNTLPYLYMFNTFTQRIYNTNCLTATNRR
jgi:hypothetical protein